MSEFDNPNVDSAKDQQQNETQQDSQQQQYQQQPYQQDQQYQQQQYQQNQQYQQQQYQQPYQPQPPYNTYEQKSKVAAGVLGILLGSLGVHNFYLGYIGKAVAQLLITIFTCGFGAVATGIWGLVEGIMILTGSIAVDGRGVPLRD